MSFSPVQLLVFISRVKYTGRLPACQRIVGLGARLNDKGEFQHMLAKKITIYARESYCPGPLGRPAVTGGAVASWRDRAGKPSPAEGILSPLHSLYLPITNPHYECRMGARKRLARKGRRLAVQCCKLSPVRSPPDSSDCDW